MAFAQSQAPATAPAQAPAGAEAVLREQVEKFYKLQMDGKFRQSEASVCEDSKDAYYTQRKRQWLGVDIKSLQFDENRGLYLVTTALGMNQSTPAGIVKVTYPTTTFWREEQGKWCMHIPPPPDTTKATPFGSMKAQSEEDGKKLKITPVAVEAVQGGVKADRSQLTLSTTGTSSDQLTITNSLPGGVALEIIPLYTPGLKMSLSKTDLKAKESATLKVEFTPVDDRKMHPLSTSVMVHPINIKIPVQIFFTPPATSPK